MFFSLRICFKSVIRVFISSKLSVERLEGINPPYAIVSNESMIASHFGTFFNHSKIAEVSAFFFNPPNNFLGGIKKLIEFSDNRK